MLEKFRAKVQKQWDSFAPIAAKLNTKPASSPPQFGSISEKQTENSGATAASRPTMFRRSRTDGSIPTTFPSCFLKTTVGSGDGLGVGPKAETKISAPVDESVEGTAALTRLPSLASEPLPSIPSFSQDELKKPQLTKDDFIVVKTLGQGNFARVFLVHKVDDGHLYAMKVMEKASVLDHGRVRDVFSERNVLKRAKHPFIVKLEFAFQTEHQMMFVMNYLEGGDLSQYLAMSPGKRLSEAQANFYAAEICLALQYLHDNGVVYRDLKPSNVLLDRNGHACLADMGLCKIFESDESLDFDKRCSSLVGSPSYIAPEILMRRLYDHRVDWWSFGVTLFRMLCGEVPFHSKNINQMFHKIIVANPDFRPYPWISAEAKDFLSELLQKDPLLRLCGTEAKAHPFFTGTNWADIYAKRHPPPDFVPHRCPSVASAASPLNPTFPFATAAPPPSHTNTVAAAAQITAHGVTRGASSNAAVLMTITSPLNFSINSTQQKLFENFSFGGEPDGSRSGDFSFDFERVNSRFTVDDLNVGDDDQEDDEGNDTAVSSPVYEIDPFSGCAHRVFKAVKPQMKPVGKSCDDNDEDSDSDRNSINWCRRGWGFASPPPPPPVHQTTTTTSPMRCCAMGNCSSPNPSTTPSSGCRPQRMVCV